MGATILGLLDLRRRETRRRPQRDASGGACGRITLPRQRQRAGRSGLPHLGAWRRYDQTATSFLAFVDIAAVRIWTKDIHAPSRAPKPSIDWHRDEFERQRPVGQPSLDRAHEQLRSFAAPAMPNAGNQASLSVR